VVGAVLKHRHHKRSNEVCEYGKCRVSGEFRRSLHSATHVNRASAFDSISQPKRPPMETLNLRAEYRERSECP
jgi:hypothetical protein